MIDIAKQLKCKKNLISSLYTQRKGINNPTQKAANGEYVWYVSTVCKILRNQLHVGAAVSFRTFSKSYKLKDRLNNPEENWEVHRDVHEAIIDRAKWEAIPKTFAAKNKIRIRNRSPLCVCSGNGYESKQHNVASMKQKTNAEPNYTNWVRRLRWFDYSYECFHSYAGWFNYLAKWREWV